jgi:hypothetical protein
MVPEINITLSPMVGALICVKAVGGWSGPARTGLRLAQQLRQLGEVRRHATGFVPGEQLRRRAALRFIRS